jgi:hypothetical protein
MRSMKWAVAVLAAGTLALGSGAAFAAESTTSTPAKPATPAVAKAKAMGLTAEARESKAQQQGEVQAEKSEAKGQRGREVAADRIYDGVVTHVDTTAHPNTLVMNTMLNKQVLTVGVDVLPSTRIMQRGAMKTLADISKGDRIWMKWDRTTNHLIADQIHILPTGKKVAARAAGGAASTKATPAA